MLALTATLGWGASPGESNVQGTYMEARTADVYTGPCFANGEAGIVGKRAVLGWQIEKGNWEGVKLDGLGVVGVVRANDTLGYVLGNAYPVRSVLIIDEDANLAQRDALKRFAQKMSGDLLDDIVRIEIQPISLVVADGNIHAAKAQLLAGELAKIETRAINNGDHICSNEEIWYRPLAKLDHAMPAYALAHSFQGQGLDTRWKAPDQRSAFVGEFHYQD
jgi:hypothetical protein